MQPAEIDTVASYDVGRLGQQEHRLLVEVAVPVHVLRKIAGHGLLTTTQRYLNPRELHRTGDLLRLAC